MPKKNIKVYIVDGSKHNTSTLTDGMFVVLCEKYGRDLSLVDFQIEFNSGKILPNSVIRFI